MDLAFPTTGGATGPTGPAGPPGTPYETVTSDTAASAGNVARRKTNGHVEKATGGTQADSLGVVALYSAAVLLGASTDIYKPGSRLPVAGLPVGDLYRSNTGTAVLYASLVVGEWTNGLGYSDGNGLDVNISEGFEVT